MDVTSAQAWTDRIRPLLAALGGDFVGPGYPFDLRLSPAGWQATMRRGSAVPFTGPTPEDALSQLYAALRREVVEAREAAIRTLTACQVALDQDDKMVREVMQS